MRRLISIFKASIVSLLIVQPTAAQWFDKIYTESDWEFYFRDGYFDYNSYQLYRELAEGADISDTVEFIVSSMGVASTEIVKSPIYSERYAQSFLKGETARSTAFEVPVRVRFGRTIFENENKGYLLLRSSRRNLDLTYKGRDENGAWETERRSIDITNGAFRVRLGNFSSRIGCGLGIGRLDYRPVSYESDPGRVREFLFPDNSFYNGFIISYKDI